MWCVQVQPVHECVRAGGMLSFKGFRPQPMQNGVVHSLAHPTLELHGPRLYPACTLQITYPTLEIHRTKTDMPKDTEKRSAKRRKKKQRGIAMQEQVCARLCMRRKGRNALLHSAAMNNANRSVVHSARFLATECFDTTRARWA